MKLIVKIVLIIIVTCTQVVAVYAASSSYTSAGDGNWNTPATWSPLGVPVTGDDVTINHDVILDVSIGQPGLSSLTISSSGSLTSASTGGPYLITIKTSGSFSVSGTMDIDKLNIKNTTGSVEINAGATVNVASIILGGGNTPMTVDGTLTSGQISGVNISGTGVVTGTTYTGGTNVFGNSSPINGTTYYGIRWTGTTNAIWETASNWYNSVIPDALQTCQIIGSLTNYPQINSNVEITKLVVESGASITINPTFSLTVTGTLTNNAGNSGVVVASTSSGTGNLIHSTQNVAGTVKRYIAGSTSNPYHFISSPIDGAAFSSIWSTGDYNVYWYNESVVDVDMDVGWTRISSGTLTNGRGYAIVGDANKTLSITGDLTVPDDISTISVSYTATTGTYPNGDPRGWNLIGNPFPTALTASTFITDNTSSLGSSWQALYYFDDANGDRTRTADYSTRTTTIGAAGSGAASGAPTDKIPVGQGFFVNVNSGVSTLSVTAAQRTTNAGSQFFIPAIDYINNIWVYVEGPSNNYNEIAFSFLAKATKNHDPIFDAAKLRGNPNIALYSFIKDSDVEYVIQGRPLFKNEDIVKIGIHAGVEGEYTFKMKKSTNSSNTENVYLIDLYKNKTTQITNTSGYTIYLSPNEYKDRFLLKFENKANSNDEKLTESSEIEVFIYNNKIHFINTDFEGEVIVSDILGKVLLNFNLSKTENRNVYLPEYRGVVIVKLVDKKGITTKKLYSR